MLLTFNTYKGFLIDDKSADVLLDPKSNLVKISAHNQNIGSKKKAKRDDSGYEYRTCGFDLLGYAWKNFQVETTNYVDDNCCINDVSDSDTKIDNYGAFLRRQCHVQPGQHTNDRNDDLSSHQSLYGDVVLKISEEAENHEENRNGNNTAKLSVQERKELRKQAREFKANAKSAKRSKKLSEIGTDTETTTGVKLTTLRSKINHLKYLVENCVKEAQSQLGSKLNDTTRIFQIDDVSVYVSDLKNLLDDEWLSDSNIGWVYAFLYHGYVLPLLSKKLKDSMFYQYEEDNKKFNSSVCLLLPTFTFLIANHPEPRELLEAKVLPSGIEDAQFVFCPLNDNDDFGSSEGGSHWSLVVFTRLSIANSSNKSFVQKALVFDSMFEANFSETQRLVSNMAQILHNPKNSKSSTDWDIVHVRESPQQTNGSDCGVFVCAVTAFLISQLVALANAQSSSAIDFSLSKLRFSAIDARIWMLSSLLNCIKNNNKIESIEKC